MRNIRCSCRFRSCLTVAILLVTGQTYAFPSTCSGGHGTPKTMIVSTDWLDRHRADENLVVLAVGKKEEYQAAHIAGSRFLDFEQIRGGSSPDKGGLILELPDEQHLTDVFAQLGVSNTSRIVLYQTKDWTTQTARVYLTLDAMGMGVSASILDGGLAAWRNEGRVISQETPAVKIGTLELCPQSDVIADLPFVRSNLHQPTTAIVDARLPEFYTGEKVPQQRRAGHIPGAANIPFSSLTDADGKFRSQEALKAMFEKAGVTTGSRVVSYCHIGQQASLLYFVARYLGYDARMFDGSWQEWSAHTELPTELSAVPAPKP